ncbi:hypothetical protein [Actinoallomurus oryzae]
MRATGDGLRTADLGSRLLLGWTLGEPLRPPALRRAARAYVTLAVVAAAVSLAGSAAAVPAELMADAGYVFRAVAFGAIPVAAVLGWTGAWVARVARRVDPATPTARALGRQVVRPGAVDLGEAGVRFPRALPMSLLGSTAGAFFLSVALGTLRFDHNDAVTEGLLVWCGLSAVPLIAGVVWWPLLRAAMSGGLAPRTVARVGWIYVMTGVLSALVSGGAVFAAGAGAANLGPALFGVVLVGALLVWRGRVWLTFARSLGDA